MTLMEDKPTEEMALDFNPNKMTVDTRIVCRDCGHVERIEYTLDRHGGVKYDGSGCKICGGICSFGVAWDAR